MMMMKQEMRTCFGIHTFQIVQAKIEVDNIEISATGFQPPLDFANALLVKQ